MVEAQQPNPKPSWPPEGKTPTQLINEVGPDKAAQMFMESAGLDQLNTNMATTIPELVAKDIRLAEGSEPNQGETSPQI